MFSRTMISLCLGAALAGGAPLASAQDAAPPAEDPAAQGEEAAGAQADPRPGEEPDAGAEGKVAVQFVRRGLTLPAMTLSPEASFSFLKLPDVETPIGSITFDPIVGLSAGATFGILDDLEVDATVVPLILSPEFEYGDPSVGATYRFLPGDFEMGARLRVYIPVQGDFTLLAGVPMLLHAGDAIRLDTGVSFAMIFGDNVAVGLIGGPPAGGLVADPGVPLRLSIQLADPFWLTAATGFGIGNFEEAGESMFIPLGLGAGFTIAGDDAAIADITGRFDFPLFLTPGSDGDALHADAFSFGLAGKAYLPL